jgi:GntR family transcriptional regulator / MocR family aminotransferase
VPPSLADPIAALRQLIDWHPPTAMQDALAGFIEDGLLDKHLRRCRRAYAERRGLLTEAISGPLSAYLTAGTANAGLHITTYLRPGLSEGAVRLAAQRQGIRTMGLQRTFRANPPATRSAARIRRDPHHGTASRGAHAEEIMAAHAAEARTAPEYRPGQRT